MRKPDPLLPWLSTSLSCSKSEPLDKFNGERNKQNHTAVHRQSNASPLSHLLPCQQIQKKRGKQTNSFFSNLLHFLWIADHRITGSLVVDHRVVFCCRFTSLRSSASPAATALQFRPLWL
ncbi:hypothetical protein QL285_049213 [Trifolium repens]|nr:hypothetical protein QL285_049213 [Trifolium repens]